MMTSLCRLQKMKRQIAFVLSIPSFDTSLIHEFSDLNPDVRIYIYTFKKVKIKQSEFTGLNVVVQPIEYNFSFFRIIPKLIVSKCIVVDNYQAFLAGFVKKKDTKIIQIWHATGAIKKFGLESPDTAKRTKPSLWRIKKVYKRFDVFVVASEAMKDIFQRSYLATDAEFLYFGDLSADKYCDRLYVDQMKTMIYAEYPQLENKKILTYMPTFRPKNFTFHALDVNQLSQMLGEEWYIIVQTHVSQRNYFKADKRVIPVQSGKHKFDFLVISDCLVTDYSSMIFNYALMGKKTAFSYVNDAESFEKTVGLQEWFYNWSEECQVHTVEDLYGKIQSGLQLDTQRFNEHWNRYNKGEAKRKFIAYITEHM
ncbi:MAG: CDP-glycerol glycerophosphotransferase family protein [Culicoidibacterales bacterium]